MQFLEASARSAGECVKTYVAYVEEMELVCCTANAVCKEQNIAINH